ncbi:hypothetical protein FJT64_001393 [Amphibalanus amphitrite]|uniref:Uncharacterized protein n=1 Tax=Amphibalanus amphitrite TaxID=1232801 RepID=A0A6A4V2J2_AMPAM|nr:hypothetical protein FJT64_001393 [Amphibalanus amphitrite]
MKNTSARKLLKSFQRVAREMFRLDLNRGFDGQLLRSINEGRELSKADRTRLLDIIYERYVEKFQSKYLKDNVDSLAGDIVEQFPGLFRGMHLHERLNATRQLIINKFKNKRRGDDSKEVTDRKRRRSGVLNYLPADKEDEGCGDLRYKLRQGMLRGAEIWAELARIRGGGSTKENELERARENLSKVLTKFQVCETNAALEHLLIELREEDALYTAPTAGGPMVIWRDALWVEGEKVADFEILINKIDQFLTWGAAFSVFAQKPTKKSTRCSAYLATVMVLQTDVLKPPKGLERITQ